MESLIEDISKGFVRGIGYILAELFFGAICYWVGWPICKVISLGKYPNSSNVVYLDEVGPRNNSFWCASVGLIALILIGLFAAGLFN